jgi:dTDP-4-dehydrorhamnose reductase
VTGFKSSTTNLASKQSSKERMHIVVFGKDGQLGKAFKSLFDSLSFSQQVQIQYVGREQCDLANGSAIEALLNQAQANLIINASAYTAVDKAESEVELAFVINAKAPEVMAKYAAKHGATFLHYSTDYVFDGEKYGFYLEDDLRNPLSVYGKSKAAGEEAIAQVFANTATGQYAIFRTSWVYGDGGNFIRTILRLAKEREELKIIADQYGVPTNADWLAQISLSLALNNRGQLNTFPSGIYHAVPAGETTWHDLAVSAVNAALEAGITLKATPEAIKAIPASEYPLPAPRPMNSRMSTDKLQSILSIPNSYNDVLKDRSFPQWEPMVHEYIRKLASNGLI